MNHVLEELEGDNEDGCSNKKTYSQGNILGKSDSCMSNIGPRKRFNIMLFDCNMIGKNNGERSN